MVNITEKDLELFNKNFNSNSKNKLALNAVTANGINESALDFERVQKDVHSFSISVEAGEITNQKQSGRCWMFASLNVMRLEIMKKLNLKNMELSQNYSLFWDKLEKSNYFLESILETLKEDVDSRLVSFLLKDPLGDGGQWDMFCSLVSKYGVVPKDAMKETISSSATRNMDKYLTLKLREFACTLRDKSKTLKIEELRKMKTVMLDTIYRMLCISLGKPPVEFVYETRDKDEKFIRIESTPKKFFSDYVGWNLDEYISLINAPTLDKPFNKTYSVQFLGNVKEGRAVKYLNLTVDELKEVAIKQLKDKKAVWFGSDVGQFSEMKLGLMDLKVLDVENLFSTDFPMTKAQRLDYGESLMTHAMVLTGVNLDKDEKPNRWRVENSWGDEKGEKGFFIMTDSWFDEYVYQIVINKKYLTAKQQELFEMEPIMLKPWDPMGSLAK